MERAGMRDDLGVADFIVHLLAACCCFADISVFCPFASIIHHHMSSVHKHPQGIKRQSTLNIRYSDLQIIHPSHKTHTHYVHGLITGQK